MGTHEEFAKFILKFNPQNNAARLALYNYIKNFTVLDSDFQIKCIDQFNRKVLQFEYWRKEVRELSREVQYFVKKFSENVGIELPIWRPADRMQPIFIDNKEDRAEILKNFLISHKLDKTTSIIHDTKASYLVTVLPESGVQVAILDHWFVIRDGLLEPLHIDQFLYYDSRLEPALEMRQSIEVAPQTLAQFKVGMEGIEVSCIHGMTFKKIKAHRISKLHEDKHIYFAVKKVERHFVDRTTDPLYLDVVSKLEDALYRVESQGIKAKDFAIQALELGENFYSHAFPDDKMIPHLLEDLKLLLAKKGLWKNSSVSTNLSLRMEP